MILDLLEVGLMTVGMNRLLPPERGTSHLPHGVIFTLSEPVLVRILPINLLEGETT